MKHVFVETNFLIEILRPLPGDEAVNLHKRNGADVTLHIPWVSIGESKRTLGRIINEDLGFYGAMQKFTVREFHDKKMSAADKQIADNLATRLKDERTEALKELGKTVDATVASMDIIEPSKAVVTKTLSVYAIKSLPPFDEMVMGAVLAKAEELVSDGGKGFYFCNLNKKDFDPKKHTALAAEYQRLTIEYLASFKVP